MLLLYTTQHEAGLITFPSSLHTINTEAVYCRTGATALSMHTKLISCLYEVEKKQLSHTRIKRRHIQSNLLNWIALGPDYEYPLRQSIDLYMINTLHCV